MEAIKRGYLENRRILIEGLPAAGLTKFLPADGAFYLYADVSDFTSDSLAFARKMLEEAHVAATPGVDFDPFHGQEFHPLLLRALGRRHARGGGADRALAEIKAQHEKNRPALRRAVFIFKLGFRLLAAAEAA